MKTIILLAMVKTKTIASATFFRHVLRTQVACEKKVYLPSSKFIKKDYVCECERKISFV